MTGEGVLSIMRAACVCVCVREREREHTGTWARFFNQLAHMESWLLPFSTFMLRFSGRDLILPPLFFSRVPFLLLFDRYPRERQAFMQMIDDDEHMSIASI